MDEQRELTPCVRCLVPYDVWDDTYCPRCGHCQICGCCGPCADPKCEEEHI